MNIRIQIIVGIVVVIALFVIVNMIRRNSDMHWRGFL